MDDRRILAGGTLDFFVDDAHIKELYPNRKLTREAFTFQLSHHLPLRVQFDTDIDGRRLDQIVQAGGELSGPLADRKSNLSPSPILAYHHAGQ